jgi:hypothetical protein
MSQRRTRPLRPREPDEQVYEGLAPVAGQTVDGPGSGADRGTGAQAAGATSTTTGIRPIQRSQVSSSVASSHMK